MAHANTFEHPSTYIPVSRIGTGAYGVVFKALRPKTDTETGEPILGEDGNQEMEEVAIKKIFDYGCQNRGTRPDFKIRYLRRICREIYILRHFRPIPQVVELKDIYLSPNGLDLYIVMTFVPMSLEQLFHDPSRMAGVDERHVRWIAVQVLLGLQALHSAGCMHRDLSRGNILVDPQTMDCVIADFGLSRVKFDAEDDISLDVVTLPYRSPEVLMQCKRYTHAVDIWSLGCVLMEFLLKRDFVHGKDALVQLWGIMDVVAGFPDLEEWSLLTSGTALQYLQKVKAEGSRPLPEERDIKEVLTSAGMSPECGDALQRMLVFHPERRASAMELLMMPWFQNDGDCKQLIDEIMAAPSIGLCNEELEQFTYEQLQHYVTSVLTMSSATVVTSHMP